MVSHDKPKHFVQRVVDSLDESLTVLFGFMKRNREGDILGKSSPGPSFPRCAEPIIRMQIWQDTEGAAVILQNISLATTVLGMFLVRLFPRCTCSGI